MEQNKNIYHLKNTINKNTHYFLKPKNAALNSLLDTYILQDYGGINVSYQLPKIRNLSQQQILMDIESKRKLSVQNIQKLCSQRNLNRLVRSQTIDEPAYRKATDIIESCEKIITVQKKKEIEFKVKQTREDDEYKAIRKADKLHKLIQEQIYQCNKEDIENTNKKAILYIKENTVTIDKDKFIQKCNRERFQLQQFRERPRKEKEHKRFRTNYHLLDL
ncbi:unnamed protein product [Paramecium pentaurelia]|uniref:Uncharacterized protein n=1 Tax=Paramecium pentaurelia TaxID=43138 RepID=A0A8S1VXX2_9CILI|nr:unnamed protein product [Paramecium pentaurelia]